MHNRGRNCTNVTQINAEWGTPSSKQQKEEKQKMLWVMEGDWQNDSTIAVGVQKGMKMILILGWTC